MRFSCVSHKKALPLQRYYEQINLGSFATMKKKSILYLLLSISIPFIFYIIYSTINVSTPVEITEEIHLVEDSVYEEHVEPHIDAISQIFIEELTQAVRQNNRVAIAKMMEYPLCQQYPLQDITNEREFIKHYNRIFPKSLQQRLDSSTIDDWSQVGWRGIMFCNGHIWIDMYDSGIKIRTVNSNIDDNPDYYTDLENALNKERKLLGITDIHIIPFACYLSKDSTTLIHFMQDTIAGECYATIYYNSQKINRNLQANSQLQLRCSHEIQGSCANDFYKAIHGNDTIEIWDVNCMSYDMAEEYAYGFRVKADTASNLKGLLDSLAMKYNKNIEIYGYYAMRPVYIQDILK